MPVCHRAASFPVLRTSLGPQYSCVSVSSLTCQFLCSVSCPKPLLECKVPPPEYFFQRLCHKLRESTVHPPKHTNTHTHWKIWSHVYVPAPCTGLPPTGTSSRFGKELKRVPESCGLPVCSVHSSSRLWTICCPPTMCFVLILLCARLQWLCLTG